MQPFFTKQNLDAVLRRVKAFGSAEIVASTLTAAIDRVIGERDSAVRACQNVMDAITASSSCHWHPSPEVDQTNWNPDAHVEVTLTVKDCRALKSVLLRSGKPPEGSSEINPLERRPMREAPKDGTAVLGFLPDSGNIPYPVRWKSDENAWVMSWDFTVLGGLNEPTHWIPIP